MGEKKKKAKKSAPTDALTPVEAIKRLNEKYCVVTEGGKVRVLFFASEQGRETAEYMSFADFRNLHMNRLVVLDAKDKDGNPITAPLGNYWLKHLSRKQYAGVTFEPLQPKVIDGKLNLWRDWSIKPEAGDWSLMQQHIFEVLAAGNQEHCEYILNFAAWCVQHPGEQAEVALVFRGPEGTGRGIFARMMCRIFGQHAIQVSNIKHVTGNFNRHLRDCCFLFADEAFWQGYRDHEGNLKRLITEPTLFIESKNVDAFEVRNRIHMIMVSNNSWVVPASMSARRFAMFDVAEHHKQEAEWFIPLYTQMDNGGLAAMLHDLLALDLGDWHPRQIIHTGALRDQQMRSIESIDPIDAWWFMLLSEGVLPWQQPRSESDERYYEDKNPRRALSRDLYKHALESVPRLKHESDIALSRALHDRGCRPYNYGGRGWEFPPLNELREEWEEKMPDHDWQDDLADWQPRIPEQENMTVKPAEDMPAKPQSKGNGNGHGRRKTF